MSRLPDTISYLPGYAVGTHLSRAPKELRGKRADRSYGNILQRCASFIAMMGGKLNEEVGMKDMSIWETVAFALVIIGGLNWGLVGFFDFNLIAKLFGQDSALSRIIYSLVGLAAVYLLVSGMVRRPSTYVSGPKV